MLRGDMLRGNIVLRLRTIAVAWLLAPLGAFAAEPVKQIGIYVQPYYQAADAATAAPRVAVGKSFDALLASTRREDIVTARDAVDAAPGRVTPMTLMVLAIRLYDVGLRDDAVFWFYAAKDRFITLAEVVAIQPSGLAQVEDAVRSFASLAGPAINGYAFCDLANQEALRGKALDWVEGHPYEPIFMTQLTAKPGDRGENLKVAIRKLRGDVEKERGYFEDAKNRNEFYAARQKNDVDTKFCWK